MTEAKKKPSGLEPVWNKVCKTDPQYTKHVNARGGFTAILAMSQVRDATELWGPVGGKWWWDVDSSIHEGLFLARMELHHPEGEKPVVQFGCYEFTGTRPDYDAPKKAVTDALTKCLSYLGFNADVFLGLFDDNKYVAERRAAVAKEAQQANPGPPATGAQVLRIQMLAAEVYGNGAADYVEKQLKRAGVPDLEHMTEDRAAKWIAHLEGQLKTRAESPDPLPLEKEAADA